MRWIALVLLLPSVLAIGGCGCDDTAMGPVDMATGCVGTIQCPPGTTMLCQANRWVCEGPGVDMARHD